jgi:hypothetical protein
VKQQEDIELDFEIDKLTNSIENAVSGEVFDTLITLLKTADSKQIKKIEWTFNWQTELKDKAKQVYKLTTVNNPTIIHGLISLNDKGDHIFMDLIESAKFNRAKTNFIKV